MCSGEGAVASLFYVLSQFCGYLFKFHSLLYTNPLKAVWNVNEFVLLFHLHIKNLMKIQKKFQCNKSAGATPHMFPLLSYYVFMHNNHIIMLSMHYAIIIVYSYVLCSSFYMLLIFTIYQYSTAWEVNLQHGKSTSFEHCLIDPF